MLIFMLKEYEAISLFGTENCFHFLVCGDGRELTTFVIYRIFAIGCKTGNEQALWWVLGTFRMAMWLNKEKTIMTPKTNDLFFKGIKNHQATLSRSNTVRISNQSVGMWSPHGQVGGPLSKWLWRFIWSWGRSWCLFAARQVWHFLLERQKKREILNTEPRGTHNCLRSRNKRRLKCVK